VRTDMTEFRIHRRSLLFAGGLLSLGLWCPDLLAQGASAPRRPKVLVCLFMRGAVDGLSVVVPHAESAYYRARSSIALAAPGKGEGAVLDLDGRFGLHPRLQPLLAAWNAGELAVVHAVGSPSPTRSHFEAQDDMESGMPGHGATSDGWLGRTLADTSDPADTAFAAMAFGDKVPRGMRGAKRVMATRSLAALALRGPEPWRSKLEHGFAALYAAGDDAVHRAGRDALAAIARARALGAPAASADYPAAAKPLADVAALIKKNAGLRAAWLDVGGWDTHQAQGGAKDGRLPRLLDGLGRALAAFRSDLGDRFEDVVLLTMSEFGRTVRQNGTGGTDHGHGTCMLVLGGPVRGKRVYGRWPGLEPADLYQGRDLAVTSDFRDLFAELAQKQLGAKHLDKVFPGYAIRPESSLGVLG
jgi:uncharacterized protein (DUF1501 family)